LLCEISLSLFDPAESYRCNYPVHIRRLGQRPLGRQFGWLWAAFAVSAYGSGIGFGAFPIIAVRVLHAGPIEVAALSSAGLAVGAAVAVPLGPWIEFQRKRPVMMAMDLARFLALLTIPAAYAFGSASPSSLSSRSSWRRPRSRSTRRAERTSRPW
jgi:hypothetical protein